MKLQMQFTFPKKGLRDLDYATEIRTLKSLKQSFIDYPSAEDCLVYCN